MSSDGKSAAGDRDIALDTFTLEHLRRYIERIAAERAAHGGACPNHDHVMVGPEGRPLHPDTITARFNRLVDKAGVPRIRLHDVRYTYATMAQDEGHNIKTLSERIGHADTSVTMKIYTPPVETASGFHHGHSLKHLRRGKTRRSEADSKAKARTCWSGPSSVAGAGFEPATSGL